MTQNPERTKSSRVPPRRLELPPFYPHRWLRGGHRQTVAAAWGPQAPAKYSAKTFQLAVGTGDEAGDELVVHDDRPSSWIKGEPLAILFHGLSGSHLSPYMTRLQYQLNQRGIRTWRVDQRGYGDSIDCKGLGHAGRWRDVQITVEHAAEQWPDSKVALYGFSMGGNLALSAVGHWKHAAPANLTSVAAVAPPIDLLYCALRMKSGMPRLYGQSFVKRLMKDLRQRKSLERLPEPHIHIDLGRWPRDIMELDDIYTAQISGFKSAEDYYAFASSKPLLAEIDVPTLILAAKDDPIVPWHIYDYTDHQMVQLHLIDQGGHVAFFSHGTDDPDHYWLDWRLLEWFSHTVQAVERLPNMRIE